MGGGEQQGRRKVRGCEFGVFGRGGVKGVGELGRGGLGGGP